MKIAHLADLHCCRENAEEALTSLRFFAEHIKTSPVDLVVIAGDVWDASMLNTEASGFNRFTDAIRDIADLAPVAMIYGTPSHDTDGSLEIFRKITCKYSITILEPGQAYFLSPGGEHICSEEYANRHYDKHKRQAILFGIPEPRKKYLLADTSAGKDETEESIREAMHRLCYFLAAKRKDYDSMPCIVLYHGDVAGCSLQNDQTIERGTGIAITIDDLNDIGADYYALGHIHKPQRVGMLPAYYAGSIYPKNFGECHKAGFNIVQPSPYLNSAGTATEGNTTVARVDFPHPQNLKIENKLNGEFNLGDQITFPNAESVADKKVWFEITCTKEQRALIDIEATLKRLLEAGASPGSRVTLCDIPTETVRAAEITEVNTPDKKFMVWAENSGIEVKDETIIKKIQSLESEIKTGAERAAGEWELVSLKLRGAIGIKKGIRKDEVQINFDDYSEGLIALVGANGMGKTTLIENCHPYPQLLTRNGKLQRHFFLRDGFREVIYRNKSLKEYGNFVKFLIQIDGQNKSGSCKYFIFDAKGFPTLDTVTEWTPRPGVDGNLKPYETELSGIFGSMDLYLRTAFITQRPTKDLPDITDATAGEKKTLFVQLAGIDYLQKFSETASDKAKQEAAKNHDAEIRVQMLESAVARKASEALSLKDAEGFLVSARKELVETTELGKKRKEVVEQSQAAYNAEEVRQGKENDARKAVDQVIAEIEALKADEARYTEAVKNKAVYESEIAEYEALQKTVEAENQKKQKHLEANMEKQQGYLKAKSDHDAKVNALKVKRDSICGQRSIIEQRIFEANHNIKLYEPDAAEIIDNCPKCGQKLPEAKIAELKARREQFVAKISKEQEEIKKHETELAEIKTQIENVDSDIADIGLDEPDPVSLKNFDETALRTATEKMNRINISQSRANLERANEAKVRIDALGNQLTDKVKILDARNIVLKELTAGVDENTFARLRKDLEDAKEVHAALQTKYTQISAEIAGLEANIKGFQRTLSEIESQEKEMEGLKNQMLLSTQEETAWDLISKAFGKDGIQALELDALAPGIADTANRILESAYGDRFKIAIETTRIGGAGKKTKQIEDFVIKVIDSEDGEAVNLEDKSGGEAVWIKRAIYDAFSVIRKRNTNFAFLSCFQDEADGALDSESKTAYCRMLEAAHAESKLRHTFIITHSNEVKAMIDQKIDMEELAKEVA